MTEQPTHLKALEEIEREGIPGLVEVLREEGLDSARHVLWDVTGWHRDYSSPAKRVTFLCSRSRQRCSAGARPRR
jgi:hypothetical protein